MIAAETVVPKKLKIKFSSQRIDKVSGTNACQSEHNVDRSYQYRVCDIQNMKQNPMDCSAIKRCRPSEMVQESQPHKKQKLNRTVERQCASLVKSLINNPCGWVFKKPVDPMALNIPDYFSIITNPMDLGTIRSKLENNQYSETEEFAADVRLTFSNAMLYNPPPNNVHKMAKKLKNIFETRWKGLEEKWNDETSKAGDEKYLRYKEIGDTRLNCPETPALHNAVLRKMSKLSKDNTQKSSSNAKLSKPVENCNHKALHRNSCKGMYNGGRHACGSVDVKPSSSPAVSKCSTCGRSACQCMLLNDSAHASSDISSERSWERDPNACSTGTSKMDFQDKSRSKPEMSKSDPDSDGAVSALDEENQCQSFQLNAPATEANSEEGWEPPTFNVQLSPTKALRAAMIKRRFADTILKAQNKALLDHGDKADPAKLRREKERLEKKQLEEKAWIESQIRAAKAASREREEMESRKQREKEREAARLALQKMEKTAGIEQNLEVVKELEKLCGCSLSYSYSFGRKVVDHYGNALERLGLFMKDDITDVDEILNEDEEEGEIFP